MADLEEFKKGREIWGVLYLLRYREIERLKLLEEKKTVYRCEQEIFVFDGLTNELKQHEKRVTGINKRRLEDRLWLYGYDLDSAIRNSIEHQKKEIECLQSKIESMRKEIERLERYKEWFPSIQLEGRE